MLKKILRTCIGLDYLLGDTASIPVQNIKQLCTAYVVFRKWSVCYRFLQKANKDIDESI